MSWTSGWTVTVDFGAGNVDLMATQNVTDIKKVQTLHKDLYPTVNHCTFKVVDKTLANSFLTTTAEIPVTIQKGGADWFVGIVRPNYKAEIGADFKEMTVEVVDKSILLQKTIDTAVAWASYKVCNPSIKTASVMHQLFYAAGVIDAELDLTLIDKTLDYFVVERKDKLKYGSTIAKILYEFGYVYNVGDDGIFVLHDLYPSSIAGGTAVDDDDIETVMRITRNEHKYEGARVIWYPHVTITDAIVFSDTSGQNDDNKCNITIANGEYYPPESDSKDVYSRYEMEDYEIIIVGSETLDWEGTNVANDTFTAGDKRALVVFSETSSGGTLTKFDIRGNAVVRDMLDEHRSVRRAVVDTDKILDYDAYYITAQVDATKLCNGLADHYNSSTFSYVFPTDEALVVGEILDLTEAVMAISTDLRVVSVEEDEWGAKKIGAEAISAYSINAITYEDELRSTIGATAAEALDNIAHLMDDNILTPVEKQNLKRVWDGIAAEYPIVKTRAEAVGILSYRLDYIAYVAAYDTLDAYLNTAPDPFDDLTVETVVSGSTLRGYFADYWLQKQELLDLVEDETYGVAPSDSDLTFYLPLNDTPDDMSVNQHHGVLTPGVGDYETSKASRGYHFDGAKEGIAMPSGFSIDLDQPFSVSGWANADANTHAWNKVFYFTLSNEAQFYIQIHDSNLRWHCLINGPGPTSASLYSSAAINYGDWYHLAATWDGTTLSFYVNGILVGSGDIPATTGVTTGNSIGAGYGIGSQWFDGLLCQLRCYSSCLTQANINFLHMNPSGTQMVPAIPKDPGTENLKAHWPMNETFDDFSPFNNHGAPSVDLGSFEAFLTSHGYHFDGASGGSLVQDSPSIGVTSDFSITGWIHPHSLHTGNFVSKDGNNCYRFRMLSTGHLNVLVNDAGGAGIGSYASTVVSIEADKTYFVAVTVDFTNQRVRFYQDGVLISTVTLNEADINDTTGNLVLGGYIIDGEVFDGLLGEFRLYDDILDAQEISFLHKNPTGSVAATPAPMDPGIANLKGYWPLDETPDDVSKREHHGITTLGVGEWDPDAGFHFDGLASRMDMANHTDYDFGTGDFSCSFWMKGDDTPGGVEYMVSKRGSVAYTGWWVQRDTANNIQAFIGEDPTTLHSVTSIITTTNGQWYHIAVTRLSGVLHLYVDGVLMGINIDSNHDVDHTLNLTFGYNDQGNNYWFDGTLKHVRLYNKALNPQEVTFLKQNMGGGVLPKLEPLKTLWSDVVGYWSLADCVKDFGPNRLRGTLNADGGNYEDTPYGRGYHFNPVTNDGVSLPVTSIGALSAWSLFARVKTDLLSGDGSARIFEINEDTDNRILIYLDTAGDAKIEIWGKNNADTIAIQADVAAVADTWYEVLVTYDGYKYRLYIDNVLQVMTDTGSRAITPTTMAIGCGSTAVTISNWDGTICQVILFNSAIQEVERRYLHLHPTFHQDAVATPVDPGRENLLAHWTCHQTQDPVISVLDSTGNGNDLDTIADTLDFTDGRLFKALSSTTANGDAQKTTGFSGAIETAGETGNLTFAAWVYFGAESDYASFVRMSFDTSKWILLAHANDTGDNPSIEWGLYDGADYQLIQYYSAAMAGILEWDTWHHIVGTIDRTDKSIKLYIDGVYISRNYYSTVHTFTALEVLELLGGGAMDDAVQDVRIYDEVLQPEHVMFLAFSTGGKQAMTQYDLGEAEVRATHMYAENFYFRKAVGSENRETPVAGDVRAYLGKDPEGSQAAGDIVELAVKEYRDSLWRDRLKAGMRSGGNIADLFANGTIKGKEALFSGLGAYWSINPNDVVAQTINGIGCDDSGIVITIWTGLAYNEYYSADGGVTWNASTTSLATASYCVEGDTDVILIGSISVTHKSTDGGVNFGAPVTVNFAGGGYVYGLAFNYADNVVIAVGREITSNGNAISRSTNLGTSWTRVGAYGTAGQYFRDVAHGAADDFVAVGDSGKLYSSANNGVNWTSRTSSFGADDIFGVDYGGGVWIAVGDNGKIARSLDMETWTQITNPMTSSYYFSAVAFGDEVFVVTGEDGRTMRSLDYGLTWGRLHDDGEVIELSYTTDIKDLCFYDTETMFLGYGYNSGLAINFIAKSVYIEAGSGIIERGINSAGEYIRFANGLQMCFVNHYQSCAINIASIGNYRSSGGAYGSTWPAAFSDFEYFIISPYEQHASSGTMQSGTTNTTWDALLWAGSSQGSTSRRSYIIGIGRWK